MDEKIVRSSIDELSDSTDKNYAVKFDKDEVERRLRGEKGNLQEVTRQDIDFIYDKILTLSDEQAIKILQDALVYHKGDRNFPHQTYEKLEQLVKGPTEYGSDIETYEFELKAEAALIGFHSPYVEVRAVTDPYDDPTELCTTIRAYFLGYLWTIIGCGVNQFFTPRMPAISISSSLLQVILYPCGKLLELIVPKWKFKVLGMTIDLNPGPWTYKEQMFSTIIFNVGIGTAYVAAYNIFTQKLPMYYNNEWANIGYQFLLILSTQYIGFGFAGIMRRLVVYPTRAVWPTLLPTIALNRALLKPNEKFSVNGWSISTYKFFFIFFCGSFLYFWFPDYIFQALSTFNWLTWIAPQNINLANITGSILGMGINPIPSFDWNIISYSAPLSTPFYSQANTYIGGLIGAFVIPAIYYSNMKWTKYLPINSNALFTNTGEVFEVTEVLSNGLLDMDKYQNYSPPFYSAGNLFVYGAFFALYPFSIIYTFFTEWSSIRYSFTDVWRSIRNPRRKHFDGFNDPHSRMMSNYKEVPDYWFLIVLLIALVLAILCVELYPTNTPVWGIFFTLGINFVFLIPISLIYAVTGFSFGLNVLVELIVGYALPGNGVALMTLKVFGYNIDGQAQNYFTDQKMGHYAKIPPRALFKGQMSAVLLQCLVSIGVLNWQISNIENLCHPHQAQRFTCPGTETFYASSVIWGVIGPKRVFSGIYPLLQWCFLIGALAPFPFLLLQRLFPKALRNFHPTLIIGGMLGFAPYNLSYVTGGFYTSFAFMYYIKRRYLSWWERYNYVLSSALSAGVAFSSIIIFFSVMYRPKNIDWWGNDVIYNGIDGGNGPQAVGVLADGAYFGPSPGQYP